MHGIHVVYDPDTKKVLWVSAGDRLLTGVASVTMTPDGMTVRDAQGRELLCEEAAPPADELVNKTRADIAAHLGWEKQS